VPPVMTAVWPASENSWGAGTDGVLAAAGAASGADIVEVDVINRADGFISLYPSAYIDRRGCRGGSEFGPAGIWGAHADDRARRVD
jgi:hypothetical protein